jgi:hypothetical protein
VITGFVVSFCSKSRLFPSLDLVRAYPGMLVSSTGSPLIPPSAVTRVYDALVGVAMLFRANLAPVSKVILPVVVATALGTVGAGMVTLGLIT